MKTLTTTLLTAALLCTLASCGNSESGQSAPIDSTNSSGTAPAQYSEGTPDSRTDTTMLQHDAMMKDTISGSRQRTLPQNSPQGNGANTSNTTDKLSVAIAIILAMIFLGEIPSLRVALGAALILCGTLIIAT